MNYSAYKSYINVGIFIGSILLTRLSTMVSPTMAYVCTTLSIALLSYLVISLIYDVYHRKDVYQGHPLRYLSLTSLIFFLGLLALRWLQGYLVSDTYNMLVTVNLTLIAIYVYIYSCTYIVPRVKQYFGKRKQDDSDRPQ